MISVFGHERIPGATNVILNHDAAAHLGLQHLMELGHREIAVIKGQSVSSDSEVRFQSILSAAAKLGLSIPAPRVVQMEGNSPSPEIGYRAARELLERGASFTALFSFNDIAAMGAMRAFQDAGFRVPLDVSVVGFDDVPGAAYHTPSLTTIHQPLRKMGMIAAETLIKRLGAETEKSPEFIEVEPDLRIRESTGPAPIANAKRPSR
jgi:LacI family transcriptional regulator